MPSVYLSPSTQEFNQFINGGSEEYYMNLIVDAMIPYLRSSGIEFVRSNPGDSVERTIEQSNEFPYDLHLALQSRGTPNGAPFPMQGIDVYHYAYSSVNGEKAAFIIAHNLRAIYPLPFLVSVVPDLTMLELSETDAPAVLVELGYYDNLMDALWIENNIGKIGRNLALSVAEFLQVPFIEPDEHLFQ
jgi:N-acetylmuramoyl-L-alanine amidase